MSNHNMYYCGLVICESFQDFVADFPLESLPQNDEYKYSVLFSVYLLKDN